MSNTGFPAVNELAKAIGISPNRIPEIVNQSAAHYLPILHSRLSLYFGNSPEFWMNLQTRYDLKMARQNLNAKDIRRIKAQRAAQDRSAWLCGCAMGGIMRKSNFALRLQTMFISPIV